MSYCRREGAILPNGDINWDCPCLGNLPNGPCGSAFRESFTCWVENKNDQDSFAEKCFDNFTKWEECLSEHREIYRSEKREENEQDEDKSLDDMISDKPEITDSNHEELDSTDNNIGSSVDTRPAIAAAFSEERPEK